jgi:hypothetical protein
LAIIINGIYLDIGRRSISHIVEMRRKQISSLRKTFGRIKKRLSYNALIMELRCSGDMDRSLLAHSVLAR